MQTIDGITVVILPLLPPIDYLSGQAGPVPTDLNRVNPGKELDKISSFLHAQQGWSAAIKDTPSPSVNWNWEVIATGPNAARTGIRRTSLSLTPGPHTVFKCPKVEATFVLTASKNPVTHKKPRRHYMALRIPHCPYDPVAPGNASPGSIFVAYVDAMGKVNSMLGYAILTNLIFSLTLGR
jgi:hypothetical protein